MTSGDFQSLPAVLTRLAHDYGVEQPTERKIHVEQFESNVHDKYFETLSTHTCIYMFLMRDEKEERKKQARSNKQTRQSNILS